VGELAKKNIIGFNLHIHGFQQIEPVHITACDGMVLTFSFISYSTAQLCCGRRFVAVSAQVQKCTLLD
jgi:hypothetical protein